MNREGYEDQTAELAIARVDRERRMLKACSYCGRIHDKKMKCRQQINLETTRKKKITDQNKLRSKSAWTKKSIEIRGRDNYICQTCIRGLGAGSRKKITRDKLGVHHIIPLKEDENYFLANEWLITLCDICHEMAEKGKISREILHKIAIENENNTPGG